jgi:L-rhamnose-H+ transport protein
MTDLSMCLALAVLGGILNGSFASPTKYVKQWKWENIWPVWAFVGMIVVPWILVVATIPDPIGFYRATPLRSLLMLFAFGVGFGTAQICFGLGLAAVGLAVGFAFMIGLTTVVGSLVPLVILHPESIPTAKGLTIIGGVAVMVIGIILCAVAGGKKEKEQQAAAAGGAPVGGLSSGRSFKVGLVICFFGGALGPFINFGLAFGTPLLDRAAELGAGPGSRSNVIWPPLQLAAFVPYIAYCAYLWRKNKTLHLFRAPGTAINWLHGVVMGTLWMGSAAIYGAAAARLGAMGPILGWPLFMSVIIITSNVWGFATGEWKGVSRGPLSYMLGGIAFLILGFVILALGARLG